MKKQFNIILFISLISAVALYAYQSTLVKTNDGDTSFVTATTATDTTEVLSLTSDGNAYITTSLSGGAATLFNHYQGNIGGTWVTLARDTMVAVGVDTYILRDASTNNINMSQFRIIRTITNSSGTQTLLQQLTSY